MPFKDLTNPLHLGRLALEDCRISYSATQKAPVLILPLKVIAEIGLSIGSKVGIAIDVGESRTLVAIHKKGARFRLSRRPGSASAVLSTMALKPYIASTPTISVPHEFGDYNGSKAIILSVHQPVAIPAQREHPIE